MSFVVRDFNTPTNHLGDIRICICNNKIEVILLNIHETESEHGQAWLYVKYPPNIDIYDIFMTILNKVTNDIFQEILENGIFDGDFDHSTTVKTIIPAYKDLMPISEDKCSLVENGYYMNNDWGNYVLFTRESIQFLGEMECEPNEENKLIGEYIINGEILENGEFIYDKPIRSHDYFHTQQTKIKNI